VLTVDTAIARFNHVLTQHGTLDQQVLPKLIEEPEFQAHLAAAYRQMQRRQARLTTH